MTTLRASVQDYLTMRRGLGFKLHDAGVGLLNFVSFMERKHACRITTRLALEWAQKPKSVLPAEWARRLSFVRGFARYRSAIDPRTQNSAERTTAVSSQAGASLFLCRPRDRTSACCRTGSSSGRRTEWPQISLPVRPPERHGPAHQRSAEPEAGRCRPASGSSDDLGKPSSASPAWCLFIIPRRRFSPIICGDEVASWPDVLLAKCSCPGPAIGWTWAMCTAPSMFCLGKSGCAARLRATDRAFMTSVIASLYRPCCIGTAPARRLSRACPYCPRTSGTFMSAILTGTSALARN